MEVIIRPKFIVAGLLVFWGGIQNGYWGFSHNPAEYAKSVTGPALILYGEKDEKVSRGEINEIFTNLPGPKWLKTYPQAAHENYLLKYGQEWRQDVHEFIKFNRLK